MTLDNFTLVRVKDRKAVDLLPWLTDLTFSEAIDGVPTYTATFVDPEWEILTAHHVAFHKKGQKDDEYIGFFDRNSDDELDAIDVTIDANVYRLVTIEVQGDSLNLEFQSRNAVRLRKKFGRRVARRSKQTRAEFVRDLVYSVKATPIDFYSRELHVKQPVARTKTKDSKRPSGAGKGKAQGKFTSTAYGPPWGGIQGSGVTAGGTDLRDGKRRYIVAADPSVLPLGSHVYIDPNPYDYDGTFLVDDTGGAIKGHRLDFFVAEGRAKQNAWGRKPVEVWLASKEDKGGSKSVATHKPYQFTVGNNEDYWTAIQRLAEEVNWRAFFHGDTFYFMDDYQLLQGRPQFTLRRSDSAIVTKPNFTWSEVGDMPQELSFDVLQTAFVGVDPGDTVDVTEAGVANGRWIVRDISGSYFGESVSVTLYQPQRPKKEPAAESADSGDDSTGPIEGTPKQIIDSIVLPLARKHGIQATPQSVAAANRSHGPTVSGKRSDHQGPPSVAWAADMSNGSSPTPQMDALAKDLAKRFDIPWSGSGAVSHTANGYRFQLIYRSNVGGDHFNHVHFGVKKV